MEITIDQALQQSDLAHREGKIEEAERIYQSILYTQPTHPDANHNLGALYVSLDKSEIALPLFRMSLKVNPNIEQFWISYITTLIKLRQFANARQALNNAKKNGVTKKKLNILKQHLVLQVNGSAPSNIQLKDLLEHYQNERYDEAEKSAIFLTEQFPNHQFGWKVLGVILGQTGRQSEAVYANETALKIDPNDAEIHNNLGLMLQELGRLNKAEVSFRKAIDLKSNSPAAYTNLGITLQKLGRLEEAEASYRKAIELKPDFAEAHNNLGDFLRELQKLKEAEISCRKAIKLKPNFIKAHNNLGIILQKFLRLEDAEISFRKAIDLNPNFNEAHNNLGLTLQKLLRLEEAEASYRKAISLNPNLFEVYNNLGNTLHKLGRYEDAEASFNKAILLNPNYAEAFSNLGTLLQDLNRFEDSELNSNKAIFLKPYKYIFYNNKNFFLHYSSFWSPQFIYDEHLKFEKQFGGLDVRTSLPASTAKHPSDKLRIGYVSGDFINHSVAYFFEPLLEHHNAQSVETFCYYNNNLNDATTNRLIEASDHWRSIFNVSDVDVVNQIKTDKIDILVDLSGHTAKNRLLVFAQKPAPVQVTWLGYPNTTGLSAIDYRFTDQVADPIGEADELHSEELFRLPHGFHCYKGNKEAAVETNLPQKNRGYITFGSFNDLSKVTPEVIKIWSKILLAVPKSKLLLKSSKLNQDITHYLKLFKQEGVNADRIEYHKRLPNKDDHLKLYNSIDIGLDPFPFNGATTTCEALWMGVPVITLSGDRHVGRVGSSLLTNIGLTDFIAEDNDSYVEIASNMASNTDYLQDIRQGLRARLEGSPLCDGQSFAEDIEMAYKEMWNNYLKDDDL